MPVTTPTAEAGRQSPGAAAGGGAGDRAAARKLKRRDMLKQYYGVQEEAGTAPTTQTPTRLTPKEKPPDPLDLDSTAFNKDLYLNKLLNEKALPDLIQRDNEVVAEIKQLDGDMKTLVYENYSKFISATDTIRSMKTNIENMESQMDQLFESMSLITTSSESINRELSADRAKLHQLNSVDNLLRKLHFVFELPTRLRECVDNKEYSQAVKYYARVAGLLERYRHMAVFTKIEEECRAIIENVSKLVMLKLNNSTASLQDMSDSIGLLLRLNAKPAADLVREHLRIGSGQLQRSKDACSKHMADMKASEGDTLSQLSDEPLPADVRLVVEKIVYLDNTFIKEFADVVDSYSGFFLQPKEHDAGAEGMKSADSKVNAFGKLSAEQQLQARSDLVAFIDNFTKQYIGEIEELLQIPEDITKVSPLAYIHVLDRVHRDMQTMEPLKKLGRIDKRVNAMSFELLSNVITAVFTKIKKEFFDRYKDIRSSEGLDHNRFVRELNSWMKNTLINEYLPILERFVSRDIDFMRHSVFGPDDILDQIQRGLDVFWLSFAEDMVAYNQFSHAATKDTVPPLVTLMMSRSALELSMGTVEGVMSAYTDILFSRKGDGAAVDPLLAQRQQSRNNLVVVTATGGTVANPSMGNRGFQPSVSGTSRETMLRAREISGLCKSTAQTLLTLYVERVTLNLATTIQEHLRYTNWEKANSPTNASEALLRVLDDLTAQENDVGQLYGDEGSRDRPAGRIDAARPRVIRAGHSRHNSSSQNTNMKDSPSMGSFRQSSVYARAAGKFDPMSADIEKLFAEKVEYYGPVELTRAAALSAVGKLFLKCFVEEVRLLTLDTGGFQQMQLDIEMLKVHMWGYISDERLFNTLIEEIQTCAFRRCPNPQLLDHNTIETVVLAYRGGS
ncbi:exocyst complex component Sec5-domain-containing protein [Fimicolochytrium jonesii]|uniref:exocyst complex component Sec5-domain-containing protein n=1 Tax=Fimicolochytrium jonesii TaxID=1396493 RepID=UPI0022FE578A|nr:exocyst complex component Sec5-domain-containing protein [Fimicolochytrium jonesii]KAI8822481.1 exocyst complex component Sec5-domain-containing protein [Fimicolochytrium jonesii]